MTQDVDSAKKDARAACAVGEASAPGGTCSANAADLSCSRADNDTDRGRTACVVMASGRGERFGSQKLLAPLAGTAILEWTVRALPLDVLDAVVVAADAEVAGLCSQLGIACLVHDGALQSDTLKRGLDFADGYPACVFVPGDMPLVAQESIRRIVAAGRHHAGSILRLAHRGRVKTPTLFPADLFEGLRSLEGDVGGWALLKQQPGLFERIRCVEAASAWELEDVDEIADLEYLEAIVAREGFAPGTWGASEDERRFA